MSLKTTTSLQGEAKVKDLQSHLSETPRSGPGPGICQLTAPSARAHPYHEP